MKHSTNIWIKNFEQKYKEKHREDGRKEKIKINKGIFKNIF